MENPILAVIVPCYNEEEVIETTVNRLLEVIDGLAADGEISPESFIYAVDDGSSDNTFNILKSFHEKFGSKVRVLSFTRNFGNQKAILAGLTEIRKFDFDCCITIDADLQQDETKICEFVRKFKAGYDVVYGIRNDRKADSKFKKYSALAFYKLMNLLGSKIQANHSEYRLVSRKTVDNLSKYTETNLFLRGVFPEIERNAAFVNFDVKKRMAGTSKFSVTDLFALALQGITSFSTVPLRMVTVTGIFVSLLSFVLCIDVIFETIFGTNNVPGWATIVCAISFIGGVQIFFLGIIGEYLGQLFTEVKSRPRYIVETELT